MLAQQSGVNAIALPFQQMVSVTARIIHTGKSSMHIYVVVRACDPKENKYVVTNRCFLSFMAKDEAGYPAKVNTYMPETEEDKRLEEVAMEAKDFAKQLDKDFEEKLG